MRIVYLLGAFLVTHQLFAERVCGVVKSFQTSGESRYILIPSMTQNIGSQAKVRLDISEFALGRINVLSEGKYQCLEGKLKDLIIGELYVLKVKDYEKPKEIICGVINKNTLDDYNLIFDSELDLENALKERERYCLAGSSYMLEHRKAKYFTVNDVVSFGSKLALLHEMDFDCLRGGSGDLCYLYTHEIT